MIPEYIYILYNMLLFDICFFIAIANAKKYPYYSNNRTFFNKSTYVILFVLFVFYSLYTFYGGDIARYREFVEGDYQDAYVYDFFKFEPLYVYLASISHGSLEIWKLFVYGSSLVLVYLSLIILKKDNYMTLLFYIVCCLITLGAARAVLAYSIFLFGISIYLSYKNIVYKYIGFGIIVLSYFGHTSMVLPIVLVPLLGFTLNRKRILVLLLLFPVFVGIINNIPSLLSTVSFADQALYKFDKYAVQGIVGRTTYSSSLMQIYGAFNYILFLPMIYLGVKCQFKEHVAKSVAALVRLSFYICYASFVFLFSNIGESGIISTRYFTMFPFFIFAIMPDIAVMNNGNFKTSKKLLWLGFFRCNYAFLIFMFYQSLK